MANEGCDYDDLISQNILIKREEDASKTGVVEVLKKQSDDYENLYQKQADIYRNDVDLVKEEEASHGEEDSSDSEVRTKAPAKRELSPDSEDPSSSDSDWETKKKRRKPMFDCDECDKRFPSRRGLAMHKRHHGRQKVKLKQTTIQHEVKSEPTADVKEERFSADEVSENEKEGEKVERETDDENESNPDNNDNGKAHRDDDEEDEEDDDDDD